MSQVAECRTRSSVRLNKTPRPCRSWLPITIRSAPCSRAVSTISVLGRAHPYDLLVGLHAEFIAEFGNAGLRLFREFVRDFHRRWGQRIAHWIERQILHNMQHAEFGVVHGCGECGPVEHDMTVLTQIDRSKNVLVCAHGVFVRQEDGRRYRV